MTDENFVAQIDGQTFLSKEEVDQYYELLIQMREES